MMSDWRKTAGFIGLDVPLWKAHVFDYLEAAGMVFCVHFGIDNAVDKARQHWSERKKLRKNSRKLPLGLSVLFMLGLATPASAIVLLPPSPAPCGCVWDILNTSAPPDHEQTLAEYDEDLKHEPEAPNWILVCVPSLTPPIPTPFLPPLVPPSVPPGTPTPRGTPPSPPGSPPVPPTEPPIQTSESATAALLLIGLLALRVRW